MTITSQQVLRSRLALQGLTGNRGPGGPGGAAECVGRLVVVPTKFGEHAICLRTEASPLDVQEALWHRMLIQTHVLRPTRQYVRAQDVRWLQGLTGVHVEERLVPAARSLGLDTGVIGNCMYAIANLLADSNRMTAAEMAPHLAGHGLPSEGPRYQAILGIAAIRGLTCFVDGAYLLIDDVLPPSPRMDQDDALGLLAHRFYTGHGPSSVGDFAKWSSLPTSLASRATQLAAPDLISFEVDGVAHYGAQEIPAEEEDAVLFLGLNDEAVRPYPDLPFPMRVPVDPAADGVILLGIEIVGSFIFEDDRVTTHLNDVTPAERFRIEEHLPVR